MREGVQFSIDGKLGDLDEAERARLMERAYAPEPAVVEAVSAIIARVALDGDAALLAMAERFDGARLEAVEVPRPRQLASSYERRSSPQPPSRFWTDKVQRTARRIDSASSGTPHSTRAGTAAAVP